jgi:hypothetical protein
LNRQHHKRAGRRRRRSGHSPVVVQSMKSARGGALFFPIVCGLFYFTDRLTDCSLQNLEEEKKKNIVADVKK